MSNKSTSANKSKQKAPKQEQAQTPLPNQEVETAKNALAKLPILGPAIWLYARDPMKKFGFIGDIDGTVLPPILLDQCRLYQREGIPFAFFTWALLNDEVDKRLRSGQPRIAPHEWQSGENVWLIDIVAPFGEEEQMLDELLKAEFSGKKVNTLRPDPQQNSKLVLKEWSVKKSSTADNEGAKE